MKFKNYTEVRDSIEDGDIIFMQGKWSHISHAIIMIFTNSNTCHTGIAFWMHTKAGKRLMLCESTGKSRRRIVNMSYYADYGLAVIKAVKPWEEMESNALETIGTTRYGFIEAAYIGIRETCLRFGWKLPSKDLAFEVCSSYVAGLLGLEDKIISPEKLYQQLTQMSKDKKSGD